MKQPRPGLGVRTSGPAAARRLRYSCIGTSPADHAFITGSMMRHASSASSSRTNSIGSGLSISRMRLAYGLRRGAARDSNPEPAD
jgi:hypothetical protein